MHIASLFASISVGGGVEKVQSLLSKGLVDVGYKFTHIVMEDQEPRYDYAGDIFSLHQTFVPGFGLRKVGALFQLAWKVKEYCTENNVDVLIGQGDFFFMVTGLAKILGNKAKSVAVVHTSLEMRPTIVQKVLLFFLRQHDHIVLISQDELYTFAEKYKFQPNYLSLIYNAIELDSFAHMYAMSDKPNIIDSKIYNFINIGRLTQQKGQERLISAFDLLHKEFPDTALFIAGDGDQKQSLQDLINSGVSSDAITLLGKVDNIIPYLKYANCFVLSSKFEGFPMVLIEALAANLATISIDCPTGPGEIIDSMWLVPDDKNVVYGLYTKMKSMYMQKSIGSTRNTSLLQQFDQKNNIQKRDILLKKLCS